LLIDASIFSKVLERVRRIFIVLTLAPNAGLDSNPGMGCPLRAHWAGLIKIGMSFGSETEETIQSASLLKDVAISYRASQQCSQRRLVRGFE
jgi:hypothetical protein